MVVCRTFLEKQYKVLWSRIWPNAKEDCVDFHEFSQHTRVTLVVLTTVYVKKFWNNRSAVLGNVRLDYDACTFLLQLLYLIWHLFIREGGIRS